MYQGVQAIFINAPIKSVFSVARTYPKFIDFFLEESKVLQDQGDFIEVEVHAKLMGFYKTSWLGEGIVTENRKIFFTQTVGLFKGLTAVWDFLESEAGTIVSIKTTFNKQNLGVFVESFLGNQIVEKTTGKILKQLKEKSLAL